MSKETNDGYYEVELFRDGVPYATRTMTCGPKTFTDALSQWHRSGYTVKIRKQPKTNK